MLIAKIEIPNLHEGGASRTALVLAIAAMPVLVSATPACVK